MTIFVLCNKLHVKAYKLKCALLYLRDVVFTSVSAQTEKYQLRHFYSITTWYCIRKFRGNTSIAGYLESPNVFFSTLEGINWYTRSISVQWHFFFSYATSIKVTYFAFNSTETPPPALAYVMTSQNSRYTLFLLGASMLNGIQYRYSSANKCLKVFILQVSKYSKTGRCLIFVTFVQIKTKEIWKYLLSIS